MRICTPGHVEPIVLFNVKRIPVELAYWPYHIFNDKLMLVTAIVGLSCLCCCSFSLFSAVCNILDYVA